MEIVKSGYLAGCREINFGALPPPPPGYKIYLDADESHYFWYCEEDDRESVKYCNRFDCLSSAKIDYKRKVSNAWF